MMPRNLYVALIILAAISISLDSVAQITSCTVRRRGFAKIWRFNDAGDVVDHIEDNFLNRDPGDLSFTAEAFFGGANCFASHSMNFDIGDSAVTATGIHSLEINHPEENHHRNFYTKIAVDGTFTSASNFKFSYSGVAYGGQAHVLVIEHNGTAPVYERFPLTDGEFSLISPILGPGEYEYSIALIDYFDGSHAFSRAAGSDFSLAITPTENVGAEIWEWGMIKALFR